MKRRRSAARPAPKKQGRKPLPKLGKRGKIALIAILIFVFVLSPAVMFGSTQLENHNSFCASCHTEGEQTFYNQSLAAAPVDLASYHELKNNASRCIDCHTGAGILGRVGGLMAGASDLVSFAIGNYPKPAVQDTPLSDDNCLKCHATIFDKQDMNNHFHVFLSRWKQADPAGAATCATCHNGHNTKGDVKIMYLNEQDTTAVCQRCHATIGGGG